MRRPLADLFPDFITFCCNPKYRDIHPGYHGGDPKYRDIHPGYHGGDPKYRDIHLGYHGGDPKYRDIHVFTPSSYIRQAPT